MPQPTHTRGHKDGCREQGLAEWSTRGLVQENQARPLVPLGWYPQQPRGWARDPETLAPLCPLQAGSCDAQACLSSAAFSQAFLDFLCSNLTTARPWTGLSSCTLHPPVPHEAWVGHLVFLASIFPSLNCALFMALCSH